MKKYCYDNVFNMISNYYWMKQTIIQNEMLIEQSKSNSFLNQLNQLNQFKIEELKSLKLKVD